MILVYQKTTFSVCDTIRKMNGNISLKLKQKLYTKHHQINQKTSKFHIFFQKKTKIFFKFDQETFTELSLNHETNIIFECFVQF